MKSRMQKAVIRGTLNGKTVLLDYDKVYIVLVLAIYRVLYEEFGFGPERLTRISAKLAEFFRREDLTTIGDELTYWADHRGIKY